MVMIVVVIMISIDIVTNNLNAEASLFENRTSGTHRLLVELRGANGNAFGLGAKVEGGAGGEGEMMMQKRRDENSVRVTNLAEDVVEQDLSDLFGRFGHVQRIFIAKDRETGESRGFAFINFTRREEAQAAIDTLDGFGYANLILSVSWAAPREPK